MAKRWDFDKAIREFRKKKAFLPKIIGNMAVRHYKKSFKDGGFTDASLTPWEKRRGLTKQDRRTQRSRGLLIQSGTLRRSIRVKEARFARIRVGSYGLVYASIHNRGLKGLAFGKHPFKMPKRQFIGKSQVLSNKIVRRVNLEIRKVFNK